MNDSFHFGESQRAMVSKVPTAIQGRLLLACVALRKATSVVTFIEHFKGFNELLQEGMRSTADGSTQVALVDAAIQWIAFQARRFDHCFGPWCSVGLTDHSLAEPTFHAMGNWMQNANCGLAFGVRDLCTMVIFQEEHLGSLLKFGSLRIGLMNRQQDCKEAQMYKRHVADELLMELVLRQKNSNLDKLSSKQLFLPNIPMERMPAASAEDCHSHKAHVSSEEQVAMAQGMKQSFQQSPLFSKLVQPGWPAPLPVTTWKASISLAPTKRVSSGGASVRQHNSDNADKTQGAHAQKMTHAGWRVVGDTGALGADKGHVLRVLNQGHMLQRQVMLQKVAGGGTAQRPVAVHLGMWPSCEGQGQQCIGGGNICMHLRFVYHHHLGLPWDDLLSWQQNLTVNEAVALLNRQGGAPHRPEGGHGVAHGNSGAGGGHNGGATHKLCGLDVLSGKPCTVLGHKGGDRWCVSVLISGTQVPMEVNTCQIDPAPSAPAHAPPPSASHSRPGNQAGGRGGGPHVGGSASGRKRTFSNSAQGPPPTPRNVAGTPTPNTGRRQGAVDMLLGEMMPWRWYLCRLNKALVKCKGQHSRNNTTCTNDPKCNLQKGSLVFCVQGHMLHTGEAKHAKGPGPYERYAVDKSTLYFCTSKSCTTGFVHKPHPRSKTRLNHFCLSREAPEVFRSPSQAPMNIVLCPTTQLSSEEKLRINQDFGTHF